jgi:ketosteroid isomerase-like protein
MRRVLRVATMSVGISMMMFAGCARTSDSREEILKSREHVWRAFFANDRMALEQLVPPDTLVISSGETAWKHQKEVFQAAADFQAGGGKLVRLEFPRTEIQRFGDVAVLYTTYLVETESGGKHEVSSGRATEIFVFRDGKWVNPGWHTDSEK